MLTIIKNNGTEEIVQTEREKINNQTGNSRMPKRLNTLTLCKKLVTEQLNLRKITVAKLAREIGITRPTLYNLLDDNPAVSERVLDYNEWVIKAKINKNTFGIFSPYFFIDLDRYKLLIGANRQ